MEDEFPGLWQQGYRHQCVAVGFPPRLGLKLHGETKDFRGWRGTRKALLEIKKGDFVVAALKNNRIGRIGTVIEKHVEDHEWNPLVPVSGGHPTGQMGRRINVRWDLANGPDDRDMVVALPEDKQFNNSERRRTVAKIRSQTLQQLHAAMNDSVHWVGLLSSFKYERALSDYIAAYPHRLEDGLTPYPNAKVREKVFDANRKRADVLLLDRTGRPVVVECKQGAPTTENISQLREYMKSFQKETHRRDVRGVLVHGGSRNIRSDVIRAASAAPRVEIVQYHLQVDFTGSSID